MSRLHLLCIGLATAACNQPPTAAAPEPAIQEEEPEPQPEPVPEADDGPIHFIVNSRPWSHLVLDGTGMGRTDWSGELSQGPHSYTMTTGDGRTHSGTLQVESGKPTRFRWDFDRQAACVGP